MNESTAIDESFEMSSLMLSQNGTDLDPSKTYGVLPDSQDKENQMIVRLTGNTIETCAIKFNYDADLIESSSTIDTEYRKNDNQMDISFISANQNSTSGKSTSEQSDCLFHISTNCKQFSSSPNIPNERSNLKQKKLDHQTNSTKKIKSTNNQSNLHSNQASPVESELKNKLNEKTKLINKCSPKSANKLSPSKMRKCGVTILSNYYEIGNAIYSKNKKGKLIKTWHNYPAEYYDQLLNEVPSVAKKKRPVSLTNNQIIPSSKHSTNSVKSKSTNDIDRSPTANSQMFALNQTSNQITLSERSKSTGDLEKSKIRVVNQHSADKQMKSSESTAKSITNNLSKRSSTNQTEAQILKILKDEADNLDDEVKSRISVRILTLMNEVVQYTVNQKLNVIITQANKLKQAPTMRRIKQESKRQDCSS